MSLRRKPTLALVGATSALLIVGGVSAPALAAKPLTVKYSCSPGGIKIPITMSLGKLPKTMKVGQTIKQKVSSGSLHLDATTVGLVQGQQWTSVSGTATADGKDGSTPYKLKIAKTKVPSAAGATLDLKATGSFTLKPKKAGTYTVYAGEDLAFIQGFTGSKKANSITLDCLAPKKSSIFGTIKVKKASKHATPPARPTASTLGRSGVRLLG